MTDEEIKREFARFLGRLPANEKDLAGKYIALCVKRAYEQGEEDAYSRAQNRPGFGDMGG